MHGSLAEQIRQRASPQLAECALHFLTSLAVKTRQRKDPDEFITLHSGVLREIYTTRFHGPMMRLLGEIGAIECRAGGRYLPGSSSKCYRLARAFRGVEALPAVSSSVVTRARFIYRRAAFKRAKAPAHQWILKSYFRCAFSPALGEILETHPFPSSASRHVVLHTVGAVQRHDVEFNPDLRTGRIYYPVANLPKMLRKEVLLAGQPTVEVDIAACQPTLLAMLYPDRRNGEFNRYLELVQSERFYETIAEWAGLGWTRGEAKEAFFSQIAYSYAAVWTKLPLYPHFAARFPELMRHIAFLKCRHKAYLPLEMQSLEADIMIRGVCTECADRKIPVLPVHDSIICAREQAAAVKELVLTHWDRVTHLPCHVRIQ